MATIPPTTPPAIAATFGLPDDDEGVGVADADAAVRVAAHVVDWQVSHDRTMA